MCYIIQLVQGHGRPKATEAIVEKYRAESRAEMLLSIRSCLWKPPTPNLIRCLNKSPKAYVPFPTPAALLSSNIFPHTTPSTITNPTVQHPERSASPLGRPVRISFLIGLLFLVGCTFTVNDVAIVSLCCLVFLSPYGRTISYSPFPKEKGSRHEYRNYQPSSCFCRIMAACCSFVRWNSVPDCYKAGHEIRALEGGKLESGWAAIGWTYSVLLFLQTEESARVLMEIEALVNWVGKGLTWPLISFWFFSRALSRWLPRAMTLNQRAWLRMRLSDELS